MTLDEQKAAARKAAFARRKEAHSGNAGSAAGMLSSVLAGYRGVPCAGYMPIRTEMIHCLRWQRPPRMDPLVCL